MPKPEYPGRAPLSEDLEVRMRKMTIEGTTPPEGGAAVLDEANVVPPVDLVRAHEAGRQEIGKRKYRVLVEMEGYGKDGEEITGVSLWEEVTVDADTAEAAMDIAANMDFGNRRVSAVEEAQPIEES